MEDSELARRQGLTFAQAEGAEPLPAQLTREEISRELRSRVMAVISGPIQRETYAIHMGRSQWNRIFKSVSSNYYFDISDKYNDQMIIKRIFDEIKTGNYIKFYGLIQYFLRDQLVPADIRRELAAWLKACRSAYRVVGDTLMPVATEEEYRSITQGIESAHSAGLQGAKVHLNSSARLLGDGKWADSVRESIHAVESAARQISGSDSLSGALSMLTKAGHIHAAMNEAFKRLYGYASDQGGIRHALLDDGDAKVTESDAMFMLGACASFVTYLTANARQAGLLTSN